MTQYDEGMMRNGVEAHRENSVDNFIADRVMFNVDRFNYSDAFWTKI